MEGLLINQEDRMGNRNRDYKGWRPDGKDEGGTSNQKRATDASIALDAHRKLKGGGSDDDFSDIQDLVSDLCHLAASKHHDPEELCCWALDRFNEEKLGME
jgi:hypothetical protein